MNISNKLLKAVTGYDGYNIEIKDNILSWTADNKDGNGSLDKEMNIYEFANKCKEWAFKEHNLCLMSTLYAKDLWVCSAQGDNPFCESDNEPEAIMAALEWILDNDNR